MCAVSSIVLGVSGGVAAYKAAFVLRAFTEAGHDVRVVPTPGALHFVGAATFEALSGNRVTTDVWSDVPEIGEHTSELQSRQYLVCRLLLEKKKNITTTTTSSPFRLSHTCAPTIS